MQRSDILSAIGVIAEFNPLHTGHKYLLTEARRHGTVIAAVSGNFVQRGDIAIFDKRKRAAAALACGADIVLEIPVSYAMSTAQNFALGGVSVLSAFGCESLIFGSECGDTAKLENAADVLSAVEYKERLKKYLDSGLTFAAAREKAAGLGGDLLCGANNNLAIEYIAAARAINADMKFLTVSRLGAGHDAETAENGYAAASLLREKMRAGDLDFCKKYIPPEAYKFFTPEDAADIKRLDRAILAVLRQKTPEDLKKLPDISEGIENKLFSAIRLANSTEELYNTVKVKRYTHARIRRLALSAFLGLDNEFFMKPPPYVRVLGFNKRGEEHLKQAAERSPIPVITRVSDIERLSCGAKRLFAAECRATDMFSLALPVPQPCGAEYTAKIIKTE